MGREKRKLIKKILNLLLLSTLINFIIIAQESRLPSFLHHSENINNQYAIFDKYSKNLSIIDYYTYNKTNVYGNKWTIKSILEKQKKLKDSKLIETDDHYILIGKDDYWINADDVYINNSSPLPAKILFNQITQNNEWIPTWYLDVIKCNDNDFEKTVYKHASYLKNKRIVDTGCWWYKDSLFSYPCVFRFQNTYFSMTVDGWGVQNFIVKEITQKKETYYITCSAQGFSYNDYVGNIDYLDNFPRVNNEEDFSIRLEIISNLIYLYNNETNELIVELMNVTPEWIDKLQTYFNTGHNVFLSKKENKEIDTFNLNKLKSVSENLKLRSDEATSSQVLTVMSAGTKVKILELGKAETIDGISSNWVKVEVQANAKDRDGKPIKAGTVGWCYGGYLK